MMLCASDSDALLLAAAELVGSGSGLLFESDASELDVGLVDVGFRESVHHAEGRIEVAEASRENVGEHLRSLNEIEVLKYHADAAANPP
jgi:hypothetical protein